MKGSSSSRGRCIWRACTAFILGALVISGCAQQEAGVGRGGTGTMGGAVQGTPLSLSNKVTAMAGSSTSSGSITPAGGTGSTAGDGGLGGITTDGTSLYATDWVGNVIGKMVIATGAGTTLASAPYLHSGADGVVAGTGVVGPRGITTDGKSLYIADSFSGTIREVNISTGAVTTLAGSPDQFATADGIGTAARFTRPTGITTDGTNLYVTDTADRTIRKIEISSGTVTTLAGIAGSTGFADGTGAAASFTFPEGITTDGTNLYVADFDRVRKIAIATGEVTTLFVASGNGEASSRVHGVTSDGTSIYVTEDAGTVTKVAIATGVATTVTASVTSSIPGIGTAALREITTDGKSLYVTDVGNNVIWKIE